MKHSILQKTLSVLLCLALLVSCCAIALAKEDVTPVIVVSGMGSRPLTDTDTGKDVFPPEADTIIKNVFLALGPVLGVVFLQNTTLFDKYGAAKIHDILGGLACDENGNSVRNIETPVYPESVDHYKKDFADATKNELGFVRTVAESIGWENTYFFNYDWRDSPLDIAEDLDVMVQHVKEVKKTAQVNINALSMGGCVMTAYLAKYGGESIHNLVMASTAFQGVDMVGAMFTGDLTITVSSVLDYFVPFLNSVNLPTLAKAVERMNDAAKKDGMETTDGIIKGRVESVKPAIYNQIMMDTFARSLGVWSFIPADLYAEAKAYITNIATVSDSFLEKADQMHEIQLASEKLLKTAETNGTNVYIVGAYGFAGIPVTKRAVNHTDNLIDTYHMTGNCAVAPYGKTLSEVEGFSVAGGCGNKSHDHFSTDGIIYAGACMFPETTWIIKGMSHVEFGYDHDTSKLALWLTTNEDHVTVYSDARYPQFTELDRSTGHLVSLTRNVTVPTDETPVPQNFLEKIVAFFRGIFEKFGAMFSN